MIIKVTIGLEEFIDFQHFYLKTEKVGKTSVYLAMVIGPVLFFLLLFFFGFTGTGGRNWIPLLFVAFLSVGWIYFIHSQVTANLDYKFKKEYEDPANVNMFGESEIILHEYAFEVKDRNTNSIFKWKTFVGYKESEKNLFLFISRKQAFILPKGQITSDEIAEIRKIITLNIKNDIL